MEQPRVVVKKRRGPRTPYYGGAWKVAYADFVTAMMAVFIVLWLFTQADTKLRHQVAQYFRDPGVLPTGAAKTRDPVRVVPRPIRVEQDDGERDFLEAEKKRIDDLLRQAAGRSAEVAALRNLIIVQVTDAGLSLDVVDDGRDLLFDPASARLAPGLVELLKALGGELGQLPNHVQLGGHTDSRPFAPDAGITNWELAFARANAARRVLEAHGLRPGQVRRVVGYADSEPLVPDNPLADANRRLSILAERR